MKDNSEIIHEFIFIMNANQYRGGVDSNKKTIIRLKNY